MPTIEVKHSYKVPAEVVFDAFLKKDSDDKKVHLIFGNDEEVDCKVDGVALALETHWLVKV